MVAFTLNGKRVSVRTEPGTPLLWAVREHLALTGTKYGCGAGLCGACTVHVNGKAVKSCQTQISEVEGARVLTIEGLSDDSSHPLQKAFRAEQNRDQIVAHMNGNICRCGTYNRIVAAIQRASKEG
jgi:isoquinoline 1-oxidoreductase alpha subunit